MNSRAMASSTAEITSSCRRHSAALFVLQQRQHQQQQHRRRFVSAARVAAAEVDATAAAADTARNADDNAPPSVPPTTFRVSLSDVSPAGTSPLMASPSLKPPRLRLDTFLSSRLAVSNSTNSAANVNAAAAAASSPTSPPPPSSASRARVAAAVRSGLVSVNGAVKLRPSEPLRVGDAVSLSTGALPPPPPLNAVPEPQPEGDGVTRLFEVAYEDEQVIVVDKAAGVVVHPGARHQSGTLVNVLLYHCGVREAAAVGNGDGEEEQDGERGEGEDDDEDGDLEEEESTPSSSSSSSASAAANRRYRTPPSLLSGSGTRPGIVHRLDKGTTGLLVVAKTPEAHASLAEQFRDRTVRRRYVSLCVGVPKVPRGVVETNIDRGTKERTRMEAFPFQGRRGRPAVSEFRVVEVLAGGGASVVEWRLRTGRTHQIRVHARHIGCPLLGDEVYGGGNGSGAAAAALAASAKGGGTGDQSTTTTASRSGKAVAAQRRAAGGALPRAARNAAAELVASIKRPALHARSLGFTHPTTREEVDFEAEVPRDLVEAIERLRAWGS